MVIKIKKESMILLTAALFVLIILSAPAKAEDYRCCVNANDDPCNMACLIRQSEQCPENFANSDKRWEECIGRDETSCPSATPDEPTIFMCYADPAVPPTPSCTDECTPENSKQCAGTNSYKTCVRNADSDSCLEWSAVSSCPQGQICRNGNCISQPECNDGEEKCQGRKYWLCENNKWQNKGIVPTKCGVLCKAGQDYCIGERYISCTRVDMQAISLNNAPCLQNQVKCSEGEEVCDSGDYVYKCNNELKMENLGKIIGKCEVVAECNEGDVKCGRDSKGYHVCEKNLWVNKGRIIGKCGVIAECKEGETWCFEGLGLLVCENGKWKQQGRINCDTNEVRCNDMEERCKDGYLYLCKNNNWEYTSKTGGCQPASCSDDEEVYYGSGNSGKGSEDEIAVCCKRGNGELIRERGYPTCQFCSGEITYGKAEFGKGKNLETSICCPESRTVFSGDILNPSSRPVKCCKGDEIVGRTECCTKGTLYDDVAEKCGFDCCKTNDDCGYLLFGDVAGIYKNKCIGGVCKKEPHEAINSFLGETANIGERKENNCNGVYLTQIKKICSEGGASYCDENNNIVAIQKNEKDGCIKKIMPCDGACIEHKEIGKDTLLNAKCAQPCKIKSLSYHITNEFAPYVGDGLKAFEGTPGYIETENSFMTKLTPEQVFSHISHTCEEIKKKCGKGKKIQLPVYMLGHALPSYQGFYFDSSIKFNSDYARRIASSGYNLDCIKSLTLGGCLVFAGDEGEKFRQELGKIFPFPVYGSNVINILECGKGIKRLGEGGTILCSKNGEVCKTELQSIFYPTLPSIAYPGVIEPEAYQTKINSGELGEVEISINSPYENIAIVHNDENFACNYHVTGSQDFVITRNTQTIEYGDFSIKILHGSLKSDTVSITINKLNVDCSNFNKWYAHKTEIPTLEDYKQAEESFNQGYIDADLFNSIKTKYQNKWECIKNNDCYGLCPMGMLDCEFACQNNKCAAVPAGTVGTAKTGGIDEDQMLLSAIQNFIAIRDLSIMASAAFAECSDSDENDPFTAGTVSFTENSISKSKSDSCISLRDESGSTVSLVKEYYCGASKPQLTLHRCENGCANGACKTDASATPPASVSASCTNECTPSGKRECIGTNSVRTCLPDSAGCLKWSSAAACPTGQACAFGACRKADECTSSGAKECAGEDSYKTCGLYGTDNTYLAWSSPIKCPTGWICQGGVCTTPSPSCTDECTPENSKQCAGTNSYKTCVRNADADSCLEWGAASICPTGQTCQNGECTTLSPPCTDECSPENSKQCAGTNSYKTCVRNADADSCLEWSAVSSCPQGQACAFGACKTQLCTDSDNGKDASIKGSVQYGYYNTYTDECVRNDFSLSGTVLKEYYCEDDQVKSEGIDCASDGLFCFNGKCSTCTDSDNGQNFIVKGYTQDVSGNSESDQCTSDGESLKEYYCFADPFTGEDVMKSVNVYCQYGCEFGTCKSPPPEPLPLPSTGKCCQRGISKCLSAMGVCPMFYSEVSSSICGAGTPQCFGPMFFGVLSTQQPAQEEKQISIIDMILGWFASLFGETPAGKLTSILETATCQDSDGDNSGIGGTISFTHGDKSREFKDYCIYLRDDNGKMSHLVNEYYCENGELASKIYECSEGCKNSACRHFDLSLSISPDYRTAVLTCNVNDNSQNYYYEFRSQEKVLQFFSTNNQYYCTGHCKENDIITCYAKVNIEGYTDVFTSEKASNSVIIEYAKPTTAISVDLTPTTAYKNSILTCNASGAKGINDYDILNYEYEFRNQSSILQAFSRNNQFACETNSRCRLNDNITCYAKSRVYLSSTYTEIFSDEKASNSVAIQNMAPTQPSNVGLSPSTAYKNTIFTCSASGSTDADNDTITYYYEFRKGATKLQAYSTNNQYTCGANCSKNDNITCYAKAYDGLNYSAERASANVNILNSLPAMSNRPRLSINNGLLNCSNYTASDADNDTLTYYYELRAHNPYNLSRNRILQSYSTSSSYNCLNLGCPANDIITCYSKAYDGSNYSFETSSDTLTIENYQPSQPLNATLNSTTNYSAFTCSASGSTDLNKDQLSYFYEFRNQNRVLQNPSTLNRFVCSGGNCRNRDVITCYAYANDGFLSSQTKESNSIRIITGNTLPTVPQTVGLSPSTAYKNTIFTCSASGSTDADNDTITYYYEFRKGTTRLQAYSTNSQYTCGANCSKNDNIKCYAKAYDGLNYSAERASSAVKILNSNPALPAATSIIPLSGYKGTNFNCTASGSTDADNDTITYYYEFRKGATKLQAYSKNSQYTCKTNCNKNDVINCYAKSYDGAVYSAEKASGNASVLDSAPTVPSSASLSPATAYTNTIFTCSASGSTDADSDTITYYYEFRKGATVLQVFSTTRTFTCNNSVCRQNDNVTCFAKAVTTAANSSEKASSAVRIK
jgi:hypothetical protein